MATISGKIARKYMAHYIDASFGETTTNYIRLGKDLEEYAISMNPSTDVTKNIIGETRFTHNGYTRSSAVSPYYCEIGDPLFEKLQQICDEELQDDAIKTTVLEVHLWEESSSSSGKFKAWKQEVYVVPESYGGNTAGYQIPFGLNYVGERTEGVFDPTTKKFE